MKGQSSVEFVAIIGVALVLAAPFVVEGQESMIELATSSEDAQFQASLNELSATAQQVSASGAKTTRTLDLSISSNIVNVYVQEKALIYEMDRGGNLQNFSQTFPQKINFDNAQTKEGLETLEITSKSGEINIRPEGETRNTIINSQRDWNKGSFNGTSADRNDNSGNLGLGYLNGTASGQPNDNGLNNDSLIGYWRMDRNVEGDGSKIIDYSGNGYDGIYNGNIQRVEKSIFGTKAVEFSGGNSVHADIDTFNEKINPPVSFALWAKADQRQSCKGTVFSRSSDTTGLNIGSCQNDQSIGYHWNDQSSSYDWTGGPDYPIDEWFFVTWVVRQDNSTIYLMNDGNIKNGTNTMSHSQTTIDDLNFGWDEYGTSRQFDGKLDEIKIFNKSLTVSEVKQQYLEGRPFQGNYSMEINNSMQHEWTKLEVDADVPSGTNLSAQFEPLDSSGNALENQVINLNTGTGRYDLNIQDSEDARVKFNGTSNNATKSWTVSDFTVYSR